MANDNPLEREAGWGQDQRLPPDTPFNIHWASDTDVGRYRPHNEDARKMVAWTGEEIVILPKQGSWSLADGDLFLAVSDGMGGALYGERASQLSLDVFFEQYSRRMIARRDDKLEPLKGAELHGFLEALLLDVHDAVNHEASHYPECSGMGATFTLLWLRSNGTRWLVHIGDSRLYRHRRGDGLSQPSHDHNYAGFLYRKGRINERELREHPTGNALTQALGGGLGKIFPQVQSDGYVSQDRFLICSDGLTCGLWDKNLNEALENRDDSLELITDQMMEKSLAASGTDNITLIVAEVE